MNADLPSVRRIMRVLHRSAQASIPAALLACTLLAGPTPLAVAQTPSPSAREIKAASTPAPAIKDTKPALPAAPAGHGWAFIVDDTPVDPSSLSGGGIGTIILHLPPRGVGQADGASGGTARLAPGFPQQADAIAWWQNRVYIALRDERMMTTRGGDWQRRVFGLSVAPGTAVGLGSKGTASWEYPPGRPELIGTLPGKVELVSFGAGKLGPVALTRHGRGRGAVELSIGTSGAWRPLTLPWLAAGTSTPQDHSTPGSSARYWVLSPRDGGLAVAVLNNQSDDFICVWSTPAPADALFDDSTPDESAPPAVAPQTQPPTKEPNRQRPAASGTAKQPDRSTPQPISLPWTRHTLSLRLPGGTTDVFPVPDRVVTVGTSVIATAWEPLDGSQRNDLGHVRLALLRPDRADEFEPIAEVPRRHQVVPMDGREPRISLVWTAPRGEGAAEEPTTGPAGTSLGLERIAEISASTGRVLYSGPLKAQAWLSVENYRLLALALVVLMAGVVMFVLRRGGAPSEERKQNNRDSNPR